MSLEKIENISEDEEFSPFTLKFVQRNKDIGKHLSELKDEGVNRTDYICNCIRFYEENKNKKTGSNNSLPLDRAELVNLINILIDEKLGNYSFNLTPKVPLTLEQKLDDRFNLDDD